MEPAVRGARIEPAIIAARLETAFFASRDPESPNCQTAFCRSKPCRRERNFWRQRPEAKNPPDRPLLSAETGNLKIGVKNLRRNGPLFDRRWFPRFGQTGWWCAQSYANRSPCYLANIRVIFENNSEPAAKSVKKTCGTGISLILRQFDIREEQGVPNCRNTERAFDELGGGKRTHSDQESGPTSYGLIQACAKSTSTLSITSPKE